MPNHQKVGTGDAHTELTGEGVGDRPDHMGKGVGDIQDPQETEQEIYKITGG
jgi:hypothetical protein